jgi:hypothetical protein
MTGMAEPADVRKVSLFQEEVRVDGRRLDRPFRYAVAAAVLGNPWHGQGFVADLQPVVAELAPWLGRYLGTTAVDALGGPDGVAAFGKMAAVGLEGEYEHAAALIHTTLFGDEIRSLVGGTAWMVGNQRICPPGTQLDVPMAHKIDAKSQGHYHSATLCIADAPRPDEIVVAVGVASGERPGARR